MATIVVDRCGIIILMSNAQIVDGVALILKLRLAQGLELAVMLHVLQVDVVSPLRTLVALMVLVPKPMMIIAVAVN